MRAFMPKGARFPVVTHSNPKTMEWRNLVALEARRVAPSEPWPGPVALEIVFGLQRPKGHYRKDGSVKPAAPLYPSGKPDTSKLVRALEDALTGVLIRDDAQVVELVARKKYGLAGAEVELRQLA